MMAKRGRGGQRGKENEMRGAEEKRRKRCEESKEKTREERRRITKRESRNRGRRRSRVAEYQKERRQSVFFLPLHPVSFFSLPHSLSFPLSLRSTWRQRPLCPLL